MGKRSHSRRRGDARLRVVAEGGEGGTRAHLDGVQELILELRKHLRSGEPMDFLALVSSFVAALRAPSGEIPTPSLSEFVGGSLIGVDVAETTAALAALSVLVQDDDELVAGMRAELSHRSHPTPLWLRDIHDTRITEATIVSDLAGSSDNIVFGFTWGDGTAGSFVVYVDHTSGTVIKDAFAPAETFREVTDHFRGLVDDEPIAMIEPLDLDEARGLLEEALANGDVLGNDFESDSWPMCRPVLEWLVSLMPEPDDEDMLIDWEEAAEAIRAGRAPLIDAFAQSAEAKGINLRLTGPGRDDTVMALVVAGAAHLSEEEFMRWTPSRVEAFFDLLPETALAAESVARRLPEVVEALAEWSLERTGAAARERADVRDRVRRLGADYVAIATSPEAAQLREAMLDYADLLGVEYVGLPIVGDEQDDVDEWLLERHARDVGGREALLALDADPLPDEDFDWSAVPDDVHQEVREVLGPLDEFTERVGGVEYRTAARRFLAAAVTGHAGVFRRRASAAGSAAIVAWLVGRENELVGVGGQSMAGRDLWAHFGVKGGSTRADTIRRAAGAAWKGPLGRPEWLVGARRAALIRARDHALAGTTGPPGRTDPACN